MGKWGSWMGVGTGGRRAPGVPIVGPGVGFPVGGVLSPVLVTWGRRLGGLWRTYESTSWCRAGRAAERSSWPLRLWSVPTAEGWYPADIVTRDILLPEGVGGGDRTAS